MTGFYCLYTLQLYKKICEIKKANIKRGFKNERKEQTQMKSQKIEQENYFDIEKEKGNSM